MRQKEDQKNRNNHRFMHSFIAFINKTNADVTVKHDTRHVKRLVTD